MSDASGVSLVGILGGVVAALVTTAIILRIPAWLEKRARRKLLRRLVELWERNED